MSSTASSLEKGLADPSVTTPTSTLFFSHQLLHEGLLGSIYGTNLGREHPPVGTGVPLGAPHLLLAAQWVQG